MNTVKRRLIACLLWNNGILVQSKNFKHTNAVATPSIAIEFCNSWAIDEIILLNVSAQATSRVQFLEDLKTISKYCFIPLSAGGWVTSIHEVKELINNGADKVVINTEAYLSPHLIEAVACHFGRQCIVVSIDYKQEEEGPCVYINRGATKISVSPLEWAQRVELLGAGEIFLTSIDRDGLKKGYDLTVLKQVADGVSIPVIASGGVGELHHFLEGITLGNADAVSAANIFHYYEQCSKKVKNYLYVQGVNVRPPEFYRVPFLVKNKRSQEIL